MAKDLPPNRPLKISRLQVPHSTYYFDVKGAINAPGATFNHILVWMGYVTLVPLYSPTLEAIAHAIYTEIILRFGHFSIIQTDLALNLTRAAVEEVWRLLQIKTRHSIKYQSRTSGYVKVMDRTISSAFRK